MNLGAWLIFVVAALLEVGGDAAMRRGLRGRSLLFVMAGAVTLGGYGLVVNLVKWDFSKLLGCLCCRVRVRQRAGGPLCFQRRCAAVHVVGLGRDYRWRIGHPVWAPVEFWSR